MEAARKRREREVSHRCCLGSRLWGQLCPFSSVPLGHHHLCLSKIQDGQPCPWAFSCTLTTVAGKRRSHPYCPALQSSVKLFWASCHQLQRWSEWDLQGRHPGGMLLCGLGVLWDWRNKLSSHPAAVHCLLKEGMLGHTCAHGSGGSHTPRLLLPSLGYLCKGHMLDPQGCAPSFILTSFPSSERGFGALWATAWWLQWLTPPADVC